MMMNQLCLQDFEHHQHGLLVLGIAFSLKNPSKSVNLILKMLLSFDPKDRDPLTRPRLGPQRRRSGEMLNANGTEMTMRFVDP